MQKLRAIAVGIVATALAAGAAPAAEAAGTTLTSKQQLKSVSVPSMCDNPAGTLKNGTLPGHYVSLNYEASKLGQIKPGGGLEAAAVFWCSQGGIGWPDHIVFYATDGAIIGHSDTASVGATAGRQSISSVSINAKGVVTVRVVAVPLSGDNELWGSAGAKLTFAWDAHKKKVVRVSKKIYSDTKGTASKVLALVKAGSLTKAKKNAKASVVKELSADWKYMVKQNKKAARKGTIKLGRCSGVFDDGRDGNVFESNVPFGARGCLLYYVWPMPKGAHEQYTSTYLFVLAHKSSDVNWSSWYVRSLVGVAG